MVAFRPPAYEASLRDAFRRLIHLSIFRFGAVCSVEMECLTSGSRHELVKTYFRIVRESMSREGKKKDWLKKFGANETDFQRVCYLLKVLKAANTVNGGVEVLGLPSMREAITGLNGKSDGESARLREHGNLVWKSRKATEALALYTFALFHAASDSAKALALGNRSCVLFSLSCFEEAAADASEALKLGFPQSKAARLQIRIAQCCQRQDRLPEARKHFQEAISLLDHSEASMRTLLLPIAKHGLFECSTEHEKMESTHPCLFESPWKCIRYEPPKFSKFQTMQTTKASSDAISGSSSRLLSAPDGTVRLRNTGHKRGWALEVTRDVSVGEVLIVDKPYASVLMKKFLHMYCYHCYKRCFNLKPCNDCAFVGFCSPSCAKSAVKRDGGRGDGLGYHVSDCGGLVPCLQLDSYAGWPKESKDSVGGPIVSHLSFACIANTSPDCLLDYVCSTGRYAKQAEGGKGHQAFVGSSVRDVAPSVLDPSDYSAAAWLVACSEYRSRADLWQRTVAAVFLTYCLSLGGYPMAWFGETDLFYTPPSPENRPDRLPASWIAACMLYHLQSVPVNGHTYVDDVFNSLKNLSSYRMREIFSALYPTLSLVNHSCDPSTFRTCASGATCFLSTLRPLKAGTEIFDCYINCFSLKPRADRQSELSSHYLFQCACEACVKDWPTLFDPKRHQMEFLRCPRCSGVVHLPARRCHHCRSTQALTSYAHLVNVEVPKQMELVSEGVVGINSVDAAGELLEKLHSLVLRPGTVWDQAQELYKMVVNFTKGSWTLDPLG
ncbi:SET and MYND domain-containing protein 4 [Taenia crassiceps]|uniref:SET and MYND domain-containing protein 4 n=1 Tax=Taenia crassiceps TaxID=6207 RepID=A0ABR4QLK0_9CEST